jgi:hypothetical protein
VPDWEEGIAIANCDLSLIDDARLIWNAYSDDAREDLFGPGPAGVPVNGTAPAPPALETLEDVLADAEPAIHGE